ncbi:MAG: LysM peptidoglycan-binding domain-containing protein, partial [Alphaproteobacteria bacterium]|nr:LysM peptidoglycan-binding domain-containing protein [Alphaproteobacteria bacterium]
MKKKSDQRFMHFSRPRTGRRPLTFGGAAACLSLLLLSACTTYLPLDQGAKVPWAEALSAAKGGPIDGNRYRVSKGEALSRIAARYDVRLSTLA